MTTSTTHNGVDVSHLVETIKAIQADPNLATFTFRARSTWSEGTYNIGEITRMDYEITR